MASEQGPANPVSSRIERCYRHPDVVTGVHCTRCGRPICPDCMIEAPVGYQCPECVKEARRAYRQGPARRARAGARSFGAASAVALLLATIVAMFVWEVFKSRGLNISGRALVELGAMDPLLVASGQWWRLLTATILHGSILHIAFNAWALYVFGNVVEQIHGRWTTLGLFVFCGFLASVASYAAWPTDQLGQPSVGASGAVFGLLGVFGVHAFRRREMAQYSAALRSVLFVVFINLVMGFSLTVVDNRAHIGGLVSGIAAGFLLEGIGPRNVHVPVRLVGFAALIAAGVAAVAWRTAALKDLVPFL
jgi:membrane associated rhomboid family serine protease